LTGRNLKPPCFIGVHSPQVDKSCAFRPEDCFSAQPDQKTATTRTATRIEIRSGQIVRVRPGSDLHDHQDDGEHDPSCRPMTSIKRTAEIPDANPLMNRAW